MTKEEFNKCIDDLESVSIETLKAKNAKYAPDDDALHNFHAGAEIMGTTTAQCIWGYATKHIVALRDKIIRDDWSDMDDALEKIQDIQNYLRFIWCAANEKNMKQDDEDYEYKSCDNCKNFNENDKEDEITGKAIEGPCASCKNNFLPYEEGYAQAKLNWKGIND